MPLKYLILGILWSNPLSFFLTLGIYRFMPDSWTLYVWFCIFLLASAWDIVSTYIFVYFYGLGWDEEENSLLHWFAKHTNYHWATLLHTLTFCISVFLFCITWPWPGFSICILILFSIRRFLAGVLNFLIPIIGW